MQIHVENITHGKSVGSIIISISQNGQTAKIVEEWRRYIPDYEPLEKTIARALTSAAVWLEAGPVNLRGTGGQFTART